MFVFVILSCGKNIKSFAPLKRKFWTILYFLCLYYGNICIYYGNICIYYGNIYKTVHNFHLNDGNDLIFSPQLKIMKTNISWTFGENMTSWSHFMARDVIYLGKDDVTCHNMTSPRRTFAKLSGNVHFHDIVLWCKYQVIWTI